MTAHVVVTPLDEEWPATMSKAVLGHLRGELAFGGVVVSDDLEMKAVAGRYPMRDIVVQGVNAGVDVFLACRRPEVVLELYRSLVQAVEDESITHETLLAAERRAIAWRDRFYRPGERWATARLRVGPETHGALVDEIRERLQAGA